jgi:succinate-semialdehyde dehydrogenase/glutarate-semialdehyde dehydrogenase
MTYYRSLNPATGETVAEYAAATAEEISTSLESAHTAFLSWRHVPVAERSRLLRKVASLYRERKQELARIISVEMGKPVSQGTREVGLVADIFDYYADEGPAFMADQQLTVRGGGEAIVRSTPLGVLLGIMPWNYPYYQVARFAGPNLVAGNTILLKHAPQCPESSAAMEQMFHDAGVPKDAYINIYATNDQIAWVIPDPRLQGVSLTGSGRAGAAVAEIAGRHLKKVVLELGGSDPFLVLKADDLDAVVEAAVGGRLENTGQACNAAKRFIVLDDQYDAFVEKFAAALTQVEPGDPSSADAAIGPLSSTAAADRLEQQVKTALDNGAQLVAGGGREGNFFKTAVMIDITPDNPAYTEEFFGPVAQVYKVGSEEEAVRLANDTPYGLGSYVYTTDSEQALRVADQIEAGMVFINAVGAEGVELPFGGVKASGFGRELGRFGMDEFVNKKLIRVGG